MSKERTDDDTLHLFSFKTHILYKIDLIII